ncbi:hypothetical protein [Haloarchaeobius sp. TZWWS8]|uniref:hypothetical protein n=1 Tax=Haloarchaeobius sp. TZWWS8 TaxID=3446121 RepID=UPI003EB6F722
MSEGELGSIFSTEEVEDSHEYPESIFEESAPQRRMLVVDSDGTTFELTDEE